MDTDCVNNNEPQMLGSYDKYQPGDIKRDTIIELYKALLLLGAEQDLLATVRSWDNGLDDVHVLSNLKNINGKILEKMRFRIDCYTDEKCNNLIFNDDFWGFYYKNNKKQSFLNENGRNLMRDFLSDNAWLRSDCYDDAVLLAIDSEVTKKFDSNKAEYWDELRKVLRKYIHNHEIK